MSNNPTPTNPKVLRALAHDIADGLHHIEATIGMKQNKEADLRADLLKLEGDPDADPVLQPAELKGSILVFDQSRTATGVAKAALKTLNEGPVNDFISDASTVLGGILGKKYSNAWLPTGFPDQSTAVPDNQDDCFALLNSLKNYFIANPTHELNQPPHRIVTAALAGQLHTQMSDARDLLHTREGEQEAAKIQRDADNDALSARVSGTLAELRQLLPADSPHWDTLGLNIPAHPVAPLPVTSLTLAHAGPGRVIAEWPHARRAERYRVQKQIVGTDDDFIEAAVTTALEQTLKALPVGATVNIRILAANEAGDATPSPVASIVVT